MRSSQVSSSGGGDEDLAGIQEEVRDFGKAAHDFTLAAGGIVPFEIGVDTIEQGAEAEIVGVFAILKELTLEHGGQGLAPDVAGSGDEDEGGTLVIALGALIHRDGGADPLLIADGHILADLGIGIRQGFEDDATAADLIFIDQDKAAGAGELIGGIEGDGVGELEGDLGDVVMPDFGFAVVGGVIGGVDDFMDLLELDALFGAAEFEEVIFVGDQGLLPKPEKRNAQACGDGGGSIGDFGDDLAAVDVDLLGHGEADGLAGLDVGGGGGVEFLEGEDAGAFAGGEEDDFIVGGEATGGDGAGDDAAGIAKGGEFVDILDGEAQGLVGERFGLFEGIEGFEQGGAVVPGHVFGAVDDVVAFAAGDGDVVLGLDAEALQVGGVGGADFVEDGGVVVDEVHFVDDDDDFADAEHAEQVAVTAGVFLDAFGGVDDEDGGFGVGGAGDHVFDEFDVAGGVYDDVVALGGLEEDAGGIDGDVHGLFVFEGVDEEGVFEGFAGFEAAFADGFQFAFGEGVGVGEEAADDGGFAVVDVADEDDVHLRALRRNALR